jgi:hypothetical protein
MLNRSAYIVRLKQPFIEWINEADPMPTHGVSLKGANDDATVYLVEVEEKEEFQQWLALNHEIVFEELLSEWYTDPNLWPRDRSLKKLKEWCDFEFHSLVLDTGGSPLKDDEANG